MSDTDPAVWWGDHDIAADSAARWRIGPLTLLAGRDGNDWLIAHRASDDPLDAECTVAEVCPMPTADEDFTRARFAFERGHARLRLTPVLADRAAAVQPEAPVSVPSGEAAIFYVSTPVWVRLAIGGAGSCVAELPTFRPSDTWFGRPTAGELCYATRTRGMTRAADVARLPHRAVTPVRVVNAAPEALAVERLKLPLPNIGLYRDSDGGLVTPSVEYVRERSGASAVMRVGAVESGAQAVAGPRIRLRENRVLQTFEWFFTHGQD